MAFAAQTDTVRPRVSLESSEPAFKKID